MKKTIVTLLAAIVLGGTFEANAQIMKAADLEKYAKQRYGDKWLDAAANLAEGLTLDKNESLTYQQVIEAPGKTREQLYLALNYWAVATFKDKQAITLNDKEAGCIIITSTLPDIAEHTGTLNKYSVSITPDVSGGWLSMVASDERTYGDSKRKKDDKTNAFLYDEQWEIAHHYPFVQKDAKKRTCAKALVMTHAYSNAVMDKIEEAVRNGVVGNENDDW